MSEEQSAGKMWMSVAAIVVIVGAGYFIYRQSQPDLGNVPQINLSREEVMKRAMGDGPGAVTPANSDPNVPKTVDIKKSRPTP